MDIDTFERDYYDTQEITGLICPECQDGKLVIYKKNVKLIEYRNEVKGYNGFENDNFKYSFHGFLVCNNCLEKIVFSGKASSEIENYNDTILESYSNDLKIEYIERPPFLFKIDKKIPSEIKEIIIDSFKLFWLDIDSCANKIRICIELLMDLFNVKKYTIIKNKRRLLSLHERIIIFSGKNLELKNILTSIKWIGNFASHKEKINKDDIIDGYILLEYVINRIFDFNRIEAIEIAKIINRKKKPRSKY
jgi:hypothetical protein